MPPHHHPLDDCDGCRRTQEMLSDIVAAKLKSREGTFKEHFMDHMKAHPDMWDVIEAFNAAYERLQNEDQSSA